MRYIKSLILTLVIVLGAAFVFAPTASAVDLFGDACNTVNSQGQANLGASSPACQQNAETNTGNNPISGQNGVLFRVGRFLSILTGVIAIFVIVISAIKFVTAGGNKQSAASARSWLTYAVVGLVVSSLAYFIVSAIGSQIK